jgi:hypothetical protein
MFTQNHFMRSTPRTKLMKELTPYFCKLDDFSTPVKIVAVNYKNMV